MRLSSVKNYLSFPKEIRMLIVASFISGLVGGMVGFMLSLYFQSVGFSLREIGIIGGMSGISTTLTYLFTPKVSAILGNKKTMILALLIGLIGSVLLLISVNLILYLISSVLGGISGGLFSPAFIAVLSNKIDSKNSKYVYSAQSFSHQIGIAIGTILGGVLPPSLMKAFSLQISIAFWWSILISILIGSIQLYIIITTNIEDDKIEEKRTQSSLSRKLIAKFALTQLLIGLGAGLVIPWIPIFFTNRYFLPYYPDYDTAYSVALPLVSTVMTIVSFLMAFSFLLSPIFAEKFGYVRTIVGTQSSSVVFLVLLPFSPNFVVAALIYIIRTILMMLSSPIATSFMMNLLPPSERTKANAITMFSWNMAWSISYSLSGYLWENVPIYLPFIICGSLYLMSFALFYIFFARAEENQ